MVKDMYNIMYLCKEAFVVHMPERDLIFKQMVGLYTAEWDAVASLHAMVQENKLLYSKEQVRRAKESHEFHKNSDYPLLAEALHLLTNGKVWDIPLLMKEDLEWAYQMYGQHPEYDRGKPTKRVVGHMKVDESLCSTEKNLKMHSNVMHIDGKKFLNSK
jgi:hypothetical protein